MEKLLHESENPAAKPDSSNYFEVKNLFNDWTHMTLREDLMQNL